MIALLVNIAAGAHDVLISVASLRSWNLVEHSAMVSVVAMGSVLVQRFVPLLRPGEGALWQGRGLDRVGEPFRRIIATTLACALAALDLHAPQPQKD